MGHLRNQKKEKHLETNENGKMIHQNLRDTVKAVLRGKLIAINADGRKQERSQAKQPNFTPWGTRKEQAKPKVEIETKKRVKKSNKTKSWLKKIDKQLDSPREKKELK